jgi:FkbM family methyltransferase
MRILFIAPHLSTGGCPQYLLKKIVELNDSNEVYCVEYTDVTGGVLVVQRSQIKEILGSRLITLYEDKSTLVEHIKNINPDVIHFEELPEYFCDKKVAKQIYVSDRKYKIFETSHDSSFDVSQKMFFPDKLLIISKYQERLFESLGIPMEMVEYPIEYKQKGNRKSALENLNLDPNKIHFLNVGLFTSRKNQAEIIRYAKQLLNHPVQFHFIGNQADNFKSYWEPLMKDFPINCKWWGERKDVDTFYNAMDVFLFTSRGTANDKETSPLVIREAIGWDLPLVLYNLPVYCGMYDKYKNITWLKQSEEDNLQIIKSFLPSTSSSSSSSSLFKITTTDEENKLTISYDGDKILENVLISIKDMDSKACIFSSKFQKAHPNTSCWMMPLPLHITHFASDPTFGGYLVQIFSNGYIVFEQTIKYRDITINKPIVDFTNEEPIYMNYKEFFVEGIYNSLNIDNLNVVIDIGANVGLFTKYMLYKNAKKVFCYEPNKSAFDCLSKNYQNNSSVFLNNLAVSTNNDKLRLYLDVNNTLVSSAKRNTSDFYDVDSITLKQILTQHNLEKVDLIKIDIEGMEYELIAHMEDDVFDKVNSFIIEYHDVESMDKYIGVKTLSEKLKEKGYSVKFGDNLFKNCSFLYACKDVKVNPLTLTEIQNINNFHTDKLWLHSYLDTYEDLFSKFRNKDINLLEIGIGNGGSLKLWQKYFTGKSNIYCIDISFDEVTHKDLVSQENMTIIWKDIESCTPSILNPIMFDIVIEDGSHYLKHQIKSWELFKDRLNPGGILVIEDIAPESYDYFLNLSQKITNSKFIDLRHIKNRYDDVLFVYENK